MKKVIGILLLISGILFQNAFTMKSKKNAAEDSVDLGKVVAASINSLESLTAGAQKLITALENAMKDYKSTPSPKLYNTIKYLSKYVKQNLVDGQNLTDNTFITTFKTKLKGKWIVENGDFNASDVKKYLK